ncbi:unnamed protein product [Mycena citricolor]|uniref:RRM domain-containing protein n=1 Tax=Mycena citricolor TaxID=2018698 RepID=A0AAD2JV68_9AGAR|nr:unnamed protein product [Mycena citricolor]
MTACTFLKPNSSRHLCSEAQSFTCNRARMMMCVYMLEINGIVSHDLCPSTLFLSMMQAQQIRHAPNARLNAFHGTKRQVLGNHAGRAPPAWRGSNVGAYAKGKEVADGETAGGSRIFLSRLPTDVGENEVEELFKKTVGPLRESFLIYNSQGRSKGMAVVTFQRPGDAAVAREKYDGKIVDGRRPIKIEIMVDSARPLHSIPTGPPSLFERLRPGSDSKIGAGGSSGGPSRFITPQTKKATNLAPPAPPPRPATPHNATLAAPVPPRRRAKKGPKRLKKQWATSRSKEELDKEMEDYRALAPPA